MNSSHNETCWQFHLSAKFSTYAFKYTVLFTETFPLFHFIGNSTMGGSPNKNPEDLFMEQVSIPNLKEILK